MDHTGPVLGEYRFFGRTPSGRAVRCGFVPARRRPQGGGNELSTVAVPRRRPHVDRGPRPPLPSLARALRTLAIAFVLSSVLFLAKAVAQNGKNVPLSTATLDMRIDHPRGTGLSYGKVGTINVVNNGPAAVAIKAQRFFVPSRAAHSGYVGHIVPGQIVHPGQSYTVDILGVRIQGTRPAVARDGVLPPASEWIVIAPTDHKPVGGSTPDTAFAVVSGPSQRAFAPVNIPTLLTTPGYRPDTVVHNISALFPGTDIPVDGTVSIDEFPGDFAPLIVALVGKVDSAARNLLDEGKVEIPFHTRYEQARESLLLHTVWISVGALSGTPYTREHLAQELYTRFQNDNKKLTAKERKELAPAIEVLWKAFLQTGRTARVFTMVPEEPK